ncbi:MAG TPA: protein translocase subunit SecF [Alphaproteobacteria bacterium]|jgi:preprotein translocase subunit SecF|nr:protein translocase subunit SecF [Alphaproteobacteria bacterium]|tara:strand:+ start:870 stop:1805 length:936 start_codon:yes stop_codon:yes gene_type:complete
MRLKLVPSETSINFLRLRMPALGLSGALVAASIALFAIIGLNLGIDFRGGILLEARNTEGPADIGGLRSDLGQLGLGDINLQGFGTETDVLVRVQRQDGDEAAQIAAIEAITATLGEGYEIRRTEFVGPTVGAELAEKGILAVVCALLAIMVYIWFRFEWQFSIAAIMALAHDVLSTIGLFALTGFEFNLATVAAILTIAGYSINDTVVVFDRVRENLRRYKSYEQPAILNMSLNETLSRTVMTSVTTLLALLAIVLFGGAVLRDFALAMMWGVLIGTYSSVFVAVGMLAFFDLKRHLDEDDDPGAVKDEG